MHAGHRHGPVPAAVLGEPGAQGADELGACEQRCELAAGEGPGARGVDGEDRSKAGGMTSRELLEIVRGLRGLNLVGADLVEVAPAYDHADITSVAASHVAYDLVSLMALEEGA